MLTRWLLQDRKRWVTFLSLALLAISYGTWHGYQAKVADERAMHWWTYPPKFKVTNRHYDERKLYGTLDEKVYENCPDLTRLDSALDKRPVFVGTHWLEKMSPAQRKVLAQSRRDDLLAKCRLKQQDSASLKHALDMVMSKYVHPYSVLGNGDYEKQVLPTIPYRVELAYYEGKRSWIVICQGAAWPGDHWTQFVLPVSMEGKDLSPTWRR